jgi:hypothetical protein
VEGFLKQASQPLETFVRFGLLAAAEGAEVSALSCLGIFLA